MGFGAQDFGWGLGSPIVVADNVGWDRISPVMKVHQGWDTLDHCKTAVAGNASNRKCGEMHATKILQSILDAQVQPEKTWCGVCLNEVRL